MDIDPNTIPRSFGTHDGTFHADDVTACALLILCNLIDPTQIYRTRDPALLARCEYVCDVGGVYDPQHKRFDHHQVDYTGQLSSAGMVLEYLRTKTLPQKEVDALNFSLIRGIDAHDNGKDPQISGYCFFSHIISNLTPIRYDATEEEMNEAFHKAVTFTLEHLTRFLERFRYNLSCRGDVQKAMASYRDVLIFDQHIPWMDVFFELDGERHPASFIIMPMNGQWKLRGIPPTSDDRMRVRVPHPDSWAGLMNEDLKKASGIDGAGFCHKGKFISVWKTKEAATRAAELLLKRL